MIRNFNIFKLVSVAFTMIILSFPQISAAQIIDITITPGDALVSGSFKINSTNLVISDVLLDMGHPYLLFSFNDPAGYSPTTDGVYNFTDNFYSLSANFTGTTFDFTNNTGSIASIFAQHVVIFDNIYLLYGAQNRSLAFNSNVSAVPEPETYAMMLAGLGLLGFVARRKKKLS
jgi:hypothetical protein